jgi:hypothetical protein
MTVKGFQFSDPVLNALETSLSPERLATYQRAVGADRTRAMRLYIWNTAISAAFYGPLQGLEVALRNAMANALALTYGAAWYDNPACGFDAGTLNRIAAAKDELRRGRYPLDASHLVAALSFGFWVALLGSGGHSATMGAGKRNYEMTLWRPCLFRAFHHARMNRRQAHQRLDYLRTLRNRIAHHEPIFTRHLAADYQSILTVAGWIDPATRDWIDHHSRIEALLKQPRDTPGILF